MGNSRIADKKDKMRIISVLNFQMMKFEFHWKLTNFKMLNENLYHQTANDLKNQKAIGWFQGKMEFGPRALGNRSIIGDPRSETMQKTEFEIKFREFSTF